MSHIVAEQMRLIELTLADAPAAFFAAVAPCADGSETLLGAGRGLTQQGAKISCFAEAIERVVAARIPDAPPPPGPAAAAVAPNAIRNFSDSQLRNGPHPGDHLSHAEWANGVALHAACASWTAARPAFGAGTYAAPTALAWLPEDALPGDSNGLAAGRTRAEAERAALLELVERDAVGVWWYGRCRRPAVQLETMDQAGGADLRRWLQRRARRTHLLDLTHDLRIPVVAAISADAEGGNIAYGFAAKMDPSEAALSAALELLQSELSLRLAARRAALVGQPEGPAGRLLLWSRAQRLDRFAHLAPEAAAIRVTPEPAVSDPVEIVERRGPHPVLFVDLDQSDDPLRVVRAIVPGLRSMRPRFAPGRLFDVPRALDWEHIPVVEDEIGENEVVLI